MEYVWVGLGSALGGMARHGIAVFALNRWGPTFPYGTLAVNVVGSFLIGVIAVLASHKVGVFGSVAAQRFFLVGVLGGFTTFSSFSLQTLQLWEKGSMGLAVLNVVGSLLTCLVAVWLGAKTGRVLVA